MCGGRWNWKALPSPQMNPPVGAELGAVEYITYGPGNTKGIVQMSRNHHCCHKTDALHGSAIGNTCVSLVASVTVNRIEAAYSSDRWQGVSILNPGTFYKYFQGSVRYHPYLLYCSLPKHRIAIRNRCVNTPFTYGVAIPRGKCVTHA